MLIRIAIIIGLAVLMPGCSNSPAFSGPSGLTNANLNPMAKANAKAAAPIDIEAELAASTTLSGRMLTAIALERVTGRKPDPARFSQ